MDRWQPVGAALEYWFFRTSWPEGALLVDVILRRAAGSAEVRVAVSHRDVGWVERIGEPLDEGSASRGLVAGCELVQRGSRGAVGRVSWDLALAPGPSTVVAPPAPLLPARAFDLSLASWPDVTSTGSVTIDGVRYALDRRPGMACHYWGRRLLDRWIWLSASDFDPPGVAVETSLLESRLWGLPVRPPWLGYGWLRDAGRERYVASPLTGLVRRVRPAGAGLAVSVRGVHGGWSLQARAAEASFVDLGEGIAQSLRADCVVQAPSGRAVARGTAALELRDERWSRSGLPHRAAPAGWVHT